MDDKRRYWLRQPEWLGHQNSQRMLARTCLIFLLFLPVFASADAARLGHTTHAVNLRKNPSTSEPPIKRLKAGTEVEIINRDHPGWCFVLYRGQPGFIYE